MQGFSPDGHWIIFDSWRSGRRTPWKISLDGGQPTQLIDKFTSNTQVSPDGKLIAGYYRDEQPGAPWRIMIVPLEGGQEPKTFEPVSTVDNAALNADLVWAPDGHSILYVNAKDGTSNLWSQPIDGGAAKQLTNFKEIGVGPFAFSRDGKTIALARWSTRSDVVLIRDF
jgi:Tol biopolymer transport system component